MRFVERLFKTPGNDHSDRIAAVPQPTHVCPPAPVTSADSPAEMRRIFHEGVKAREIGHVATSRANQSPDNPDQGQV